eukprot:scaffold888_cov208-Alexandrium_tamarense.AAC.11
MVAVDGQYQQLGRLGGFADASMPMLITNFSFLSYSSSSTRRKKNKFSAQAPRLSTHRKMKAITLLTTLTILASSSNAQQDQKPNNANNKPIPSPQPTTYPPTTFATESSSTFLRTLSPTFIPDRIPRPTGVPVMENETNLPTTDEAFTDFVMEVVETGVGAADGGGVGASPTPTVVFVDKYAQQDVANGDVAMSGDNSGGDVGDSSSGNGGDAAKSQPSNGIVTFNERGLVGCVVGAVATWMMFM